jgi:Fur family ferric uptake transcriptional regulator
VKVLNRRLYLYKVSIFFMVRRTRQRDAIRMAFEKADRPLSPDEALAGAQRMAKGVGIATVYRAIKSLVQGKLLHTVELPGEPPRYELAGKAHHHHFHCHACGKVYEVEGCPGHLERLAPKGFRLDGHDLVLYGHCLACLTAR